jgi:hypothetical protein
MWDELFADLRMLYHDAQLPDEELCDEFIKLKHNLLDLIEEN